MCWVSVTWASDGSQVQTSWRPLRVDGWRSIMFDVVRSPWMMSAWCIFAISDPIIPMSASTPIA